MAIVESLSQPTSPTNFDIDSSGDFNIIIEFTYETGNKIECFARYDAWNDFGAKIEIAANGALQVGYNDGSYTQTTYAGSTFSDGVSYVVEFQGNGSAIEVYVDDVEKTGGDTSTHNENVGGTDKGRITHDFDTNDIELDSWPYGEPAAGTAITVGNVGAIAVAGFDPTVLGATAFTVGNVGDVDIAGYTSVVTAASTWEIGAYIYDSGGGVQVNVGNAGAVGVIGFNPGTLSADTTFTVGNVGEVGIAGFGATVVLSTAIEVLNTGAVAIAGFAASVFQATAIAVGNVGGVVVAGLKANISDGLSSAAGGITRIAMKMATILRR